MNIKKTSGEFEVRFDNGYVCGKITWDKIWSEWRFEPKIDCKFQDYMLKEIYKFMKRLR